MWKTIFLVIIRHTTLGLTLTSQSQRAKKEEEKGPLHRDFLEPLHKATKVGSQLSSHLLVLPYAGMPGGAKTNVACLRREVEAIDFFVAGLVGLVHHFIQRLFRYLKFIATQHGATKVDYLSLGMMAAHLAEELLIGSFQQLDIVVVGGKVVGA